MTLNSAAPRLPGLRLFAAIGAALAASVTTAMLVVGGLHAVASNWASDPQRVAAVVVGIVYLCVAASLLLILGNSTVRRSQWLALRPVSRRDFWRTGALWLVAYLVAGVTYLATGPLGLTFSDATDVLWAVGADNGRLRDSGPALTAVILLRICIVVPLAEELLFRGALFTWLRQRLSASATIAVTAVGFALIHQAPAMLPLALLVGLAAGVIREKTDSTTMPIVLHAAQNVAIVVLSYFVTGWQASFF